MEEQYHLINEELNEAMAENDKLKGDLALGNMKANLFDKVEAEMRNLKQQVESLTAEKATLEGQLNQSIVPSSDNETQGQVSVQELQEQIDMLNEELNETMSENEDLKAQINVLNFKLQTKDVSNSQLTEPEEKPKFDQTRLTELEEQLQLVNEELNETMSENEELKVQINEMKMKHLGGAQSVEQEQKPDSTSRLMELEEQLQLVNEDLNEAMTENDQLKGQVAE